MFQKRAEQLLQQRQNSNDEKLLRILIEGFSNQKEFQPFRAFEIPALYPLDYVQEILSQIDYRLLVSFSGENKLLISLC